MVAIAAVNGAVRIAVIAAIRELSARNVVTLDTWLLGWRPADLSEAFLPGARIEGGN